MLNAKSHPTNNRALWICLLISLAGAMWSALFIYQSSYIALDGHRYYGLFDDAMISMRYAWNFAHGQGLVWNAGQRVEGYTNLLMTLLMSLAALVLSKPLAVLAIQVMGVVTLLAISFVTKGLSDEVNRGKPYQGLIGILAFAAVFFYFPLSYWTLMGMETGLLTLLIMASALFALRWLRSGLDRDLVAASLLSGLAFVTRNDSLIFTAVIFGLLLVEARTRKLPRPMWLKILFAGCIYLVFPIAQTVFRLIYYGQPLPNTYTLKLAKFPLSIRLIGGMRFVLPYLEQTALILLFALLALVLDFKRVRIFLLSFLAVALAYQVYVGGDPWPSWRMLAPAMPPLFILAIMGAADLVSRWTVLASRKYLTAAVVVALSVVALLLADLPFLEDMSVRAPTSAAIANRVNTNTAIAINHMTNPNATVGVIWAGTLPYYTDRQAIDFLGKSDPHIASLNADVSGAVSWSGMISVPGHNKYDLDYSIVELMPTYIQAFSWGDQTVKPWVVQHYVRAEYHGIQGTKTLFLQKDSPDVCWEQCGNDYKIIPWPKQGGENP
jgi:arabinofuranosyltransferase